MTSRPPPPLLSCQVLDMEEMTIWEQHTATLCKVSSPPPPRHTRVGARGSGSLVPMGELLFRRKAKAHPVSDRPSGPPPGLRHCDLRRPRPAGWVRGSVRRGARRAG